MVFMWSAKKRDGQRRMSAVDSKSSQSAPPVTVSRKKRRSTIHNDDYIAMMMMMTPPTTLVAPEPSSDQVLNHPTPSYYSNNHVMVNCDRVRLGLKPFRRSLSLDKLARQYAHDKANLNHQAVTHAGGNNKILLRSNPEQVLQRQLREYRTGDLGINIQRGPSIRALHSAIMKKPCRDRNNLLSDMYNEFGMGTALASDGRSLYMVQLFRCCTQDFDNSDNTHSSSSSSGESIQQKPHLRRQRSFSMPF